MRNGPEERRNVWGVRDRRGADDPTPAVCAAGRRGARAARAPKGPGPDADMPRATGLARPPRRWEGHPQARSAAEKSPGRSRDPDSGPEGMRSPPPRRTRRRWAAACPRPGPGRTCRRWRCRRAVADRPLPCARATRHLQLPSASPWPRRSPSSFSLRWEASDARKSAARVFGVPPRELTRESATRSPRAAPHQVHPLHARGGAGIRRGRGGGGGAAVRALLHDARAAHPRAHRLWLSWKLYKNN